MKSPIPNGPGAGTTFFGGPKESGPLQGCQAEYVRVPFASADLVKLADKVTDHQAILLSDIFPTAYFGADIAKVTPGKVVAIIGCGPVGLFAITSCQLMGAARIFAIDSIPSRLALAKKLGAECKQGIVDPTKIISQERPLSDVVDAYKQFDRRAAGWIKVTLKV
ncbi:MAG: hypothetical protein JSR33_05555 [Proteobacteria bacterium]|nr:hypothetical protein [Pseudomonadota bacterium]